jgi:hypothetical protein
MKYFQPLIYLSPLVFILSVTSQACLVEQTIAAVSNSAHHEEYTHGTNKHDKPVPSHNHDNEGQESEFGCNNNLNLYILSKILTQTDALKEFDTSFSLLLTDLAGASNSFQYCCNPNQLRTPFLLRTRDRYALTCLLHAPPPAYFMFPASSIL